MERWKKTEEELKEDMRRVIILLRDSCSYFDSGKLYEAPRIATCVDMLVHDGSKNRRSILSHLGIHSKLEWVSSTLGISDGNLLADHPLAAMSINEMGPRFVHLSAALDVNGAMVGSGFPRLTFPRWWEQAVLKNPKGISLSRKNLICSLRDQDGGAHLDKELTDESYVEFVKKNGTGWYFSNKENRLTPVGSIPAAVTARQIAWEVLYSIDQYTNEFSA